MNKTRLCLGTVQFGMEYGINNKEGKPNKQQVFTMLDMALENNIEYIDTAVAYGDAEEILGEYGVNQERVKIISKLKPNLINLECSNAEELVEEQVRGSLCRIGVKVLNGYLLHTPENFYNPKILVGLKKCQEKELIKHYGVSVYETQHALDVVKSGEVAYIQIPYSIFDQRLDKTEFFSIAKNNGVKIFARSAFLQGLILMEEERIPSHLSEAKQYLREFDKIINKYGFTRLQAAFLFSYTHPDIDYLVFGVDNIQQLDEDIKLSQTNIDFRACREELSSNFISIDKSIIFPSLWGKKK